MEMDDVRRFFKIMMEQCKTGKNTYGGGVPVKECRLMIQKGLEHPKAKFLMEEMEKSGCSINPRKFIKAAHCHHPANGIFNNSHGICICCNHVSFRDQVSRTIIHELVHAYDDCRAKNMDWSNCYHHACAEIRATVLSNDCHYVREFLRGQRKLGGHEPRCVKRRASASVRANPNCSEAMADKAVDAIWETCYNDTKPFPER